jgi:serine/threonine-protein kinase RIO1
MDKLKARELESRLRDKTFANYQVIEYLNNGKSAAVFKAQNDVGQVCALKVFDDDLVEKYGAEIQIHRIELEISSSIYRVYWVRPTSSTAPVPLVVKSQ